MRSILLLGVIGINAWSTPCLAAKWADVGSAGVSTDKIMVDTDSLQKVDSFRVVDIMTVYSAARANSHNITLDRHVQRTAFNCADRSFVGIRTLGYLDGKQVGSSQETDDWRVKLHPLPQNPLSDRIYAIACAASIPVGEAAAPAYKPKAKVYTGSGIVVDRHGSILTNGHVVNKCKSIIVRTSDSKPLAALVSAVDPKNDLALLQTAHESPIGTPARFRSQSKAVKMGESIGVVGYPLSGLLSSEPKATFGQINSIAGINNDYTLLQISAPV
jgi:S1-C subfamily serine protease